MLIAEQEAQSQSQQQHSFPSRQLQVDSIFLFFILCMLLSYRCWSSKNNKEEYCMNYIPKVLDQGRCESISC